MVELIPLVLATLAISYCLDKLWLPLSRRYRGDEVNTVEERCCNLDHPFKLFGSRHSYIVATTFSGRKVRVDVHEGKGTEVRMDYFDGRPYELFRRANALPKLTLQDVVDTVKKISQEQPYHSKRFSCQHISRDSFNELCGTRDNQLRGEFLQQVAHFLPENEKRPELTIPEEYKHRFKIASVDYVKRGSETLAQMIETQYNESLREEQETSQGFIKELLYKLDPLRPTSD